MRWMRVPESSLKMLGIPFLLWLACEVFFPSSPNPFSRLLFLDYPVRNDDGSVAYRKGYNDLWFLAYWVICFSFIRLFWTVYILHPVARRFGIQAESKVLRFGEQGYSFVYCASMGCYGLYVMSQLPIWYFNCTPQWTEYPTWKMTPALKTYYLLQFAYWLQQFIVLALGLEKPRRDHKELVAHHFVTLYLVGGSYMTNMTWLGTMVFVTMDWSEAFIAIAKCSNYLRLQNTSTVLFAIFVVVWTYTRHWLNIYFLWSVWTEYDLIPDSTRRWSPSEGLWMPQWVKYQMFLPMTILQVINILWYYKIWRILIRVVSQSVLADDRSDDED